MRRAFRGENMVPIATALVERAQAWPQDAHAYLDCSTVLQLTGERDIAMQLQAEALRLQQHYLLPYGGTQPALRLLVIMASGDLMANTPVEFLLEQGDVALELLYLGDEIPWPATFPAHDVLMVAIAESDANQPLLQRLAEQLASWPHPVLNRPEHIAVLSRDGAWRALAGTCGVLMPQTRRSTRADLASLAVRPESLSSLLPGASFPLIVRPLGSHAGQNLEKIDTADALAAYLARVPAQQFYLASFVDYSGADGLFRKLRVVLINGQPYLCHHAISSHWMVHYLNAGMDHSAGKRAEEAESMQQFDTGFAKRHAEALADIQRRLQLPYLGIDCAETPDGRLLIFEVDNAMIVHVMDDEQLYPYKQPAMRKVFDAFRSLLDQFSWRQD
ncbi:RimK family alpha-L-glutamate ligase [Duganella sp. CY15W]|nr:RimK family alpha-L-glutamate ligase [Duganella sp. CY15W]